MQIKRKNIFKQYKWLNHKKRYFIISADYDGLICSSFLNHYLNWELAGYYDFNSIWLSSKALDNRKELIWVDLNILPSSGKSIGGQIITLNNETPIGFKTSCNANILAGINNNIFTKKFPFSTLLFLMWLHNIEYNKNDIGRLLLLHSDNTWMKIQKYYKNVIYWEDILSNYNWKKILYNINTPNYEAKVDQLLYPLFKKIDAISGYSKLTSKYLKIRSRECKLNPDWDSDIILRLFDLFGQHLKWTPPDLPQIIKRVEGKRYKLPLTHLEKIGLKEFLKQNKIFSYAITNPKEFNYTIFNKIQ